MASIPDFKGVIVIPSMMFRRKLTGLRKKQDLSGLFSCSLLIKVDDIFLILNTYSLFFAIVRKHCLNM